MNEVMAPMPRYECHKKVWALKISRVEYLRPDSTTDENAIVTIHFVDAIFCPREINLKGKPAPEVGGYMVQCEGGYISFSPEKAFEEGYSLIGK